MTATLVGVLVLVTGVLAGVVYWIRRATLNASEVERLREVTRLEIERRHAMEAAEAAAAAQRVKEFNEKADAAGTAADVADLLREVSDDTAN